MKTATMVPYAVRRTKEHVHRFGRLVAMIDSGNVDEGELGDLEWRDNLLPGVDYRVYA